MTWDAVDESGTLTAPPSLDADAHALFLDLDGTLFHICPRPEDVVADPALSALLRDVSARLGGAMAILTGRPIAEADRLLEGSAPCVAGLHGLEVRHGERIERARADLSGLEAGRKRISALFPGGALDPRVEDKGRAIALHYRHAPAQADRIIEAADDIAARFGLRVIHGKMVSELMPAGPNKGDVLKALLGAAPFLGRTPVAIGDDVTDEAAFGAANACGGISIRIGAGESAARFCLPDPEALRAWLAETK